MRVSATRAPAEAQNRLDRARLALRLAEERTGLRDSAALTVQRALSSASSSALLGASADSPQAGSSASPAPPTVLSACQDSGVLTLHGSATLLLAALALRQGATGWCGVIGGDELGWCTATEVGLDLNRVLTIPAPLLDDASTLTRSPPPCSTASTPSSSAPPSPKACAPSTADACCPEHANAATSS